MISNSTIVSMFVPVIFSFLLFWGLIVFYRKNTGVETKPLLIGALGFFVFTQVLEKVMHVVVLTYFTNYAEHPFLFGLYGGFAAGLFEELGRFIMFTWLLKKYRDFKSGVSFGIGWGGIEAILLTLMMIVPNIVFAFLINAGTLESSLKGQLPIEMIQSLKDGVLSHEVSYYLLVCVERFFAVFMQIFFSVLVLLGVAKKKFSYVWLAVLIHAMIDFPLTFYQIGYIKELWIVELYVVIIGCISFIMIKKCHDGFNNSM